MLLVVKLLGNRAGLAAGGGTNRMSIAGAREAKVYPTTALLASAVTARRISDSRCSEVLLFFSEHSGKEIGVRWSSNNK